MKVLDYFSTNFEEIEKRLLAGIQVEEPLINEAISKLDFGGGYNKQSFISHKGVKVDIVVFRLFNLATRRWCPKSSILISINHDGVITERWPYGTTYYPDEGYDKEFLIEEIKWTLAILKDQKYF